MKPIMWGDAVDSAQNASQVLELLNSAGRGGDMGRISLSMGHFILDEDGDPVPFQEKNGRLGINDIMSALAGFFTASITNDNDDVIGCSRQLSSVSLGLGGQIIIGVEPSLSIGDLAAEYKNVRYRLEQVLRDAQSDYSVVTEGFNPGAHVDELPEMPVAALAAKLRNSTAKHPACLLKGAAGLELTLEYADEADALRKLRVLQMLAPVLGFAASNTLIFNADGNDQPLRRMSMIRAACPHGKGFAPGAEPGASFQSLAEFYARFGSEGEFDAGAALLVPYPDVQLVPGGIRINVADSLPLDAALGYVALVKGIVYGPASIDLLEHFLGLDTNPALCDEPAVEAARAAVDEDGGVAVVYGKSVDEWVDLLVRIAHDGVGTEFEYLDNLQEFRGL